MKLINLINEASNIANDPNVVYFVATWYFKKDLNELFLNQSEEISEEKCNEFLEIIAKCNEKPYQYVINDAEFLDMHLFVDERVFIPRVETEEVCLNIVEAINDHFEDTTNLKLSDIGTGSGCIAIGLGHNFPNCSVDAIEISEDALEVASQNFAKLTPNVKGHLSSSLDYFIENNIKLDVIASNPPYIGFEDDDVETIVKENEPHVALYSHNYGLEIYEEILANSLSVLNDKFLIGFEMGHNQAQDITNLAAKYLSSTNYTLEVIQDLNDNDRCIIIKGHK